MTDAPTLEDAIALLCDRELRAMAPAVGGMKQMRGGEIVSALEARGLDRVDARILVDQALQHLGGVNRSRWESFGTGGRRSTYVEDYWVPVEVFGDSLG